MLGSELEDSHFRKKKLKSRALYRLPMVRPRKGMRVISPHSSELFFFCGLAVEDRKASCVLGKKKSDFTPTPMGRGFWGCRRGSGVVWVLMDSYQHPL